MSRLSPDPPQTLYYRIAGWFFRRKFGAVLDPLTPLGHHPGVLRAYSRFEQASARWNRLDPKLKDLADMAVVVKIGCPWCLDFGYWIMHTHGIPRAIIEAVPRWRESDLFTPLERLVLEYAEAMTATPPTVDDGLVAKLREHLDDGQIVELSMIVCLEQVRSRFAAAMGVPAQGFKDRCDWSASSAPHRSA
jgi:alkylhydroperoxidase family enzyme